MPAQTEDVDTLLKTVAPHQKDIEEHLKGHLVEFEDNSSILDTLVLRQNMRAQEADANAELHQTVPTDLSALRRLPVCR